MCTLSIRNVFSISKSDKIISKKKETPHLTPEDHEARLLDYKMPFNATISTFDTPADNTKDTKNKCRSDDPVTQPPPTKTTTSSMLRSVSLCSSQSLLKL
jgi:hypothetical protein